MPGLAAGAARAATPSPLRLAPISATFVASAFATRYTAAASEPGAKLTYRWTLSLRLVDGKGAADPSLPGARAAVDAACDNRGVLTSTAPTFVWHHGDADHCDHAKMGPSGHQGLVTVVVGDGTWSCTATYRGTNSGTGGAATCRKAAPATRAAYTCRGARVKLVDSSNVYGVVNGGRPPAFLTRGKAYCLVSITTYHWNGGRGAKPGTLGLTSSTGTIGPFKARSSAGQGGAPNVNWFVDVPTAPKPVVIDGLYSCKDSDPKTWSSNPQSHGTGFCIVYGVPAVKSTASTTPKTTTQRNATKPAAKGRGGKAKLSIKASPDTGNPPLAVTFTLSSPKVVQWRIDYGDGQSKVATGTPPPTIAHTYTRAGDYKPRLTVLASPSAASASSATTSVQVGTSLMSFAAAPASGNPPLRVTFTLGTSVPNISSWSLDFGDGTHTGGAGKPPPSLSHTYATAGSYRATFAVKPGQYALVAAFAAITVGGGTPPVLSLTATPSAGTHPLAVSFALATNVPGRIVSWKLVFGDGQQTGGAGRPPASVSHTYAKAGTYGAYLVVAQQQQYGGVQYVVPRGGLAISVR